VSGPHPGQRAPRQKNTEARVLLPLSPEMAAAALAASVREGVSRSEWIRRAIAERLKRQEKTNR
jgi:predicted HicB family RNase H-like nuclease